MKTKSIVLILFGFLLVQFNQAQVPSKTSADTEWFIYLNPAKGDDNNQGSIEKPIKTLAHAASMINAKKGKKRLQ